MRTDRRTVLRVNCTTHKKTYAHRILVSFLEWGETESNWYVGQFLGVGWDWVQLVRWTVSWSGVRLSPVGTLASFLEWGETESNWYVGQFLGVGWDWVQLVRWPRFGLLYILAPDDTMVMNMEQLMEWELAGETEVLVENLPQCHFDRHESHMTWPGIELGPPRWEAGH
jgi:hypothetical protein